MKAFVVCNDRGVAPDGSKGASAHLRGWVSALVAAGVEVDTFTKRLSPGMIFPSRLHALQSSDSFDGAMKSGGRPDFVYERYSLGSTCGLEWAKREKIPFVLEVNSPLVDEAREYRPHTVSSEHVEQERRLLLEADLVLSVSSPLADWIVLQRGSKPTVVIPNGCHPTDSSALQADDSNSRNPVLAFLGHPKPWHGADRLLPLVVALEGRGVSVDLLVIGGGPGADALINEAATLGLSSRLTVTGPVSEEDVSRNLSLATLALAPYRSIPFFYFCPLKIISYMMAGLVTVASDQGDVGELLGGTGVLVKPDSDYDLLEAVARLLANAPLRMSLGRKARTRALEELTWESAVQRFLRAVSSYFGIGAQA